MIRWASPCQNSGILEGHALRDVRPVQPMQVAPLGRDASEVATRFLEDRLSLVVPLLGKCDPQVHHGGLALRKGERAGDGAEALAEPESGFEPQAAEQTHRHGEGEELEPGGKRWQRAGQTRSV